MVPPQSFSLNIVHSVSQGENVTREIQALVKDLPVVLEAVGKDAMKLKQQIQLYSAFTEFVCEW